MKKTKMKKIIGMGAALMIAGTMAACSDEEVNTEKTEAETVVNESEEVDSIEVPEEEAEATEEGEIMSLDDMNAEIEEGAEGTEGMTEVYGLNAEGVTEELDTLTVTQHGVIIFGMEITQENIALYESEGYKIGDEIQYLMFEYTVKNNAEEPRNFYLDQTTAVTSDGQQIDSDIWLADGLQSEMLGAVESTGTIMFPLKDGSAEGIEWVDIIIPSVSDDNFNYLTEEHKQRVEIKRD